MLGGYCGVPCVVGDVIRGGRGLGEGASGGLCTPRAVFGRHWYSMGRRTLAQKTRNGKGVIIRVKKV